MNETNGITWSADWLYRYNVGKLAITPGIGMQWDSKNQNKYYYGVSRNESLKSGLRSYDPGNGWSPYVELSMSYTLGKDWTVYGLARYTRLSDELTDSQMVDKSWAGLMSTGITYSF